MQQSLFSHSVAMGAGASCDFGRYEAALGSVPKRIEIHSAKLAAKRDKAHATVREMVRAAQNAPG
jgi:hypothetical protein